jgi:hypothetical protein
MAIEYVEAFHEFEATEESLELRSVWPMRPISQWSLISSKKSMKAYHFECQKTEELRALWASQLSSSIQLNTWYR